MGIADSIRVAIGKTDGFPRKVELLDKNGVARLTRTYENIKLNKTMDDAQFVYAAPEGAKVYDADDNPIELE
jgi:outer membrane lipoprotein-sorting protein